MPRPAKPARLWLRPADDERAATWVILDRGRQISTRCGEAQSGAAEARFREYLAGKHDVAPRTQRRLDQTPVGDVLSIYLDEIVPRQARPLKVAARVDRLVDWWGDKLLSDITPASCRAYVAARSKGGGRRDLEDLRAAINHHAGRELHVGLVRVELPPKGKARAKYLTRDEVARLLWICWRHTRAEVPPRGTRKGQRVASRGFHDLRHLARFILLGIYTGSRTTPILRASPYAAAGRAVIDLDAKLYHRLPEDVDEAANKRAPTARLGDNLAAHLRRWRDRGAIAQYFVEWQGRPVASIKTAWRQAVTLAAQPDEPGQPRLPGVPLTGRVTPHTLRHTCVTWLKQDGRSSFDVAGFVGMSEKMVDEVYGKHDPDYQRNVANAFGSKRRKSKVSLPISLPPASNKNLMR